MFINNVFFNIIFWIVDGGLFSLRCQVLAVLKAVPRNGLFVLISLDKRWSSSRTKRDCFCVFVTGPHLSRALNYSPVEQGSWEKLLACPSWWFLTSVSWVIHEYSGIICGKKFLAGPFFHWFRKWWQTHSPVLDLLELGDRSLVLLV